MNVKNMTFEDTDSVLDQYLTFKLGREIYGIDIARIKEVLEYLKITTVPDSPEYMKGIVNLRGGIVPVADLRLKFGMEKKEITVDTCIIIVEIMLEGDPVLLGVIADSVREVVEFDKDSIEPPPAISHSDTSRYIHGLCNHSDDFCTILDIDRVFENIAGKSTHES